MTPEALNAEVKEALKNWGEIVKRYQKLITKKQLFKF